MFDFVEANKAQIDAISHVDGPLLIIAGPGTGKTFTLVQRAIYLIKEKGVSPEQIMIATFTEKAAKEIITRISNELLIRGIKANINEMYIGTIHSICLRFLKENLEYTRLKKNYRALDGFDQQYFVFQNINRFRNIKHYEDVFAGNYGVWREAEGICNYVNILTEELVEAEDLKKDKNKSISAIGNILVAYHELLDLNNLIDFSGIQTEAFKLLNDNPESLRALQNKIKYLMIDEYQDTNYIQEQIMLLLGARNNNICVVGDDDQGLYRFRGATIRNILEFPSKFRKKQCKIIKLTTNYRSNKDIVDFYNKWMNTTVGMNFNFDWDKFRYSKHIMPFKKENFASPTVIKVTGLDDENKWCDNILAFIRYLQSDGGLKDLNQIAFLFKSVKNSKAVKLANFLEENGISVYSPRSGMFFQREEVMMMLGCLVLTFPNYVKRLENRSLSYINEELCNYYENCIKMVNNYVSSVKDKSLAKWIGNRGKQHCSLQINTDYAFTGLFYELLSFEPFKTMISVDLDKGVIDKRPARNLALFSQIIGKYEYLHHLDIFTPKKIEMNYDILFNMYLRFLFIGGIAEYEDDSEYAPSGCVSFLTIHQSKGMEFPIVVVDSLSNVPRRINSELILEIENKYFKRKSFEPYEKIKFYDFWRLYYTAFSRAQDLLVLTCNETTRTPSKYFRKTYNELVGYENDKFDATEFDFKEVKDVNLKATYSFTSHISIYENCSLQYKFFKEFGFMPIRVASTLFGMLIHETIEDIHRAAMRKEEETITPENIKLWLMSNYSSLSKNEHAYLAAPQIEAAYLQVQNYADHQNGRWSTIQEAEVDVSLVKHDYILEGKIDLIRGDNNTVEIVDFKSEKKPDIVLEKEKIERYKKQLQVYAHLVEEKYGKKVSKLHLYYTGEKDSLPTITFLKEKKSINNTIKEFDDVVHKIQSKNFNQKSISKKICENCDFRYYCK